MEEKLFYINAVILGLILLQHVFLFIIYLKLNAAAKKQQENLEKFVQAQEQSAKELADVMQKFMKYLEKEFDNNFQNQKKQQEWLEKNLEVVSANALKSFNGMEQTQRFLGRMSEALGITQRTNLQDV
jgi:hypothetical protein